MSDRAEKRPVLSERRQQRNRRWMAEHGGVLAAAFAALFGGFGFRYGTSKDAAVSWLNSTVGLVVGVVLGGLLGYGLSVGARPTRPKVLTRVLIVSACVLTAVVIGGMRYLRHVT